MATIVSAANGNFSNPATWVGGVPPGNGDDIDSSHAVVIDQNVGSAGNGVKRWRIYGASASVTVDNSAARTIYFASTGSDPIGSGTSTNPALDATAHGFFVSRGTLNLTGSAANPVVVTSGDGSSPVYIHHQWGDVDFGGVARFNTANLTLKYCQIHNLGMAVSQYRGISWRIESDCTFLIENVKIDGHYVGIDEIAGGSTPHAAATIRNVWFHAGTFGRSFDSAHANPDNWTIEDCTETGCTTSGRMVNFTNRPSNLAWARNAPLAVNASVKRTALQLDGNGSGSGNVAEEGFVYNRSDGSTVTVGSLYGLNIDDLTSVFRNGVAWGTYQGIALRGSGSADVYGNFIRQDADSDGGHAPLIIYDGSHTVRNNVVVFDGVDGNKGSFTFDDGGGTWDHNTFVNLGSKGTESDGMSFGNGTLGPPAVNCKARSNLIVGFLRGIRDFTNLANGSNPNSYVIDSPPDAGVHHNATYDCTTSYLRGSGTPWDATGFDDGTTAHPNAVYGDIDGEDPGFVGIDRTPETWDASLGGPGTIENVFDQLARRSGFGGEYDSNYTIANLRTYLFAGAGPTNDALQDAGHDGVTIGAVEGLYGPTLTGWATNAAGNAITATLSEADCYPDTGSGGFTLSGTAATVSSWSISGTTLTLVLSGRVSPGEVVTISYDNAGAAEAIADSDDDLLADITNASVTNNSVASGRSLLGLGLGLGL